MLLVVKVFSTLFLGLVSTMFQEKWREMRHLLELCASESHPGREKIPPFQKKNLEIPRLSTYKNDPGESFWEKFPFNPLPNKPSTPVDTDVLEEIAQSLGYDNPVLAAVLKDLREGADTEVGEKGREATVSPPTKSAMDHGERTLDAVLSWLKKGFLAGPFKCNPFMVPLKESSLMAREKINGDIRPVLDLSSPKGRSYNEGIDEKSIRELWPTHMATAKQFAKEVFACGEGSELGKGDQDAAYKNIPIAVDQLHLQGFSFLGRIFIELASIMGSRSSSAKYDRFHTDCHCVISPRSPRPMHWCTGPMLQVPAQAQTMAWELSASLMKMMV